jgi:hypothetical protein
MKNSNLKTMVMLLAFVIMAGTTQAQDALWQLDFEKEIVFNENTDSGILLVGTSDWILLGIEVL